MTIKNLSTYASEVSIILREREIYIYIFTIHFNPKCGSPCYTVLISIAFAL